MHPSTNITRYLDSLYLTRPAGWSKYGTIRKNTQRYLTNSNTFNIDLQESGNDRTAVTFIKSIMADEDEESTNTPQNIQQNGMFT